MIETCEVSAYQPEVYNGGISVPDGWTIDVYYEVR